VTSRNAYRLGVLTVLSATLGLVVPEQRAAAAIDKAQVQALSVSEKLAAIREATSMHESHTGLSPRGEGDIFSVQFVNWANYFRNWANWTNWANWLNWANY
jgi:hypothetical protein